MKHFKLFFIILAILLIAGCIQATPSATPGATQPQAAAPTPLSTPTGEALLPAGWVTHTSQQCEYAISYPAEIEATEQTPYSQTFGFKLGNPEAGAQNFIYLSVITPEIQKMVQAGVYASEVYSYDPAESDSLLAMQVGESKSLREELNVRSAFTYLRQPDTMIGDHTAQAYENVQPWEFPAGTKEIRYYLPLDGCTYLIGGYLDTTGSNQPGAITEDLFHEIMATVKLTP